MRTEDKLLAITGFFGITIFLVVFFTLPSQTQHPSQTFLNAHLPASLDRQKLIPPTVIQEPKATLTFVGDIMLARSVEASIAAYGTDRPFAKLGQLFTGSDAVIGNFEGTVRDTRNVEITNQMVFDTTPDNVAMLARTGFTHLSLANNHANDYGDSVTDYTRQTLIDNSLIPFGDPYQSESFISRNNLNGVSISLIGFHAFGEDTESIVEAIKAEAAAGQFVIVFPHWGVEYVTKAPRVETNAAALFVSAGADLIVGAHPHVMQNIEVIDHVPVVYSLGNFLFDQDFSVETKQGLTMKATITATHVSLHFTPVNIIDRQTIPMSAEDSLAVCAGLGIDKCALTVVRQ